MKINHLIPLCGKSKRFYKSNYPLHKVNLPLYKNSLIEEVINSTSILKKNNFDITNIIITSKKLFEENNLSKYKSKFSFVRDHDLGPLYSLYLFFKSNKNLDGNFLITYSDVITEYSLSNMNDILQRDILIFTHKGFHPNLLDDYKNDFCLVNKKKVIAVKKKDSFSKNIFNNHIASGSYFFSKKINIKKLIINFYIRQSIRSEENYLIDFINYLLKKKFNVNNSKVNKFFHLGTIDNYTSFRNWLIYFQKNLLNNYELLTQKGFVLLGGKGKRMLSIKNDHKESLKIDKKNTMLKFVTKNLTNLNDIVYVVTKNKKNLISKSANMILINQTNSMFESILSIKKYLRNINNYIISSSDCVVYFNENKIRNLIDVRKPDLILFSFKLSPLQKKLSNKHTLVSYNNNNCKMIKTNCAFNDNYDGLAGVFYILNNRIFEKLEQFNMKNFSYEKRIDDYFSYILNFKKYKVCVEPVRHYIHLGNPEELLEYQYYNNFFKKYKFNV